MSDIVEMLQTPTGCNPPSKRELAAATVECPRCHQQVSETCCAYQDFDYYKDCYCYITRKDAAVSRT